MNPIWLPAGLRPKPSPRLWLVCSPLDPNRSIAFLTETFETRHTSTYRLPEISVDSSESTRYNIVFYGMRTTHHTFQHTRPEEEGELASNTPYIIGRSSASSPAISSTRFAPGLSLNRYPSHSNRSRIPSRPQDCSLRAHSYLVGRW